MTHFVISTSKDLVNLNLISENLNRSSPVKYHKLDDRRLSDNEKLNFELPQVDQGMPNANFYLDLKESKDKFDRLTDFSHKKYKGGNNLVDEELSPIVIKATSNQNKYELSKISSLEKTNSRESS